MKKIVALPLACMMALSTCSLAACGPENNEDTLWIKVVVAGYGRAWVDGLADLYEEKYPGKTVEVQEIIKDSSAVINEILSGASKFDLVFVEDRVETKYNTKVVSKDGTVYNHPFADLSDIYNENVPGESVKLKDKMFDQLYNLVSVNNADGSQTQYSVPWMKSLNGIVVNKSVLERNNYTLEKFHNTTDEMFTLCDTLISETDIVPVTYAMEASYFDQVHEAWMFQYYGTEIMKKYYQGYNMDDPDNEEARNQPEIFFTDGMLEAMKVYEKLVNPDNKYIGDTQKEKDVVNLDFTSVQNKFLESENNILFMANGLWLEREMEANYTKDELNVEFVKTPIVSALGTKLGITDGALSDIVDYVDAGQTGEKPTFTTTKAYTVDEIIEIVADARSINTSASNFHSVIPSYSTKIDMAKDFLQLMASDEGLEVMYETCGGSAPFDYSIEKLDGLYAADKLRQFTYSGNKIILQGTYNFDAMCDLFTKNGLWNFQMQTTTFLSSFASPNKADRVSAEDLWYDNYEYNQGMWQTYLTTAGIQ